MFMLAWQHTLWGHHEPISCWPDCPIIGCGILLRQCVELQLIHVVDAQMNDKKLNPLRYPK